MLHTRILQGQCIGGHAGEAAAQAARLLPQSLHCSDLSMGTPSTTSAGRERAVASLPSSVKWQLPGCGRDDSRALREQAGMQASRQAGRVSPSARRARGCADLPAR